MQWKDVHSQSWPMTPDESQFGYTPTYVHGPLLAQPFGAPVGATQVTDTMAGRGGRARRRRAKKRARAAAIATGVALPVVGAGLVMARAVRGRKARRRRRKSCL